MNRIVSSDFWNDSKVINNFTPEDKYFMLYLLTNPHVTPIGIYEVSFRMVAFEMGYSVEAVASLFDRFVNKYGLVFFSKGTNEVAIKNFLLFAIIKGGAPVHDVMVKYIKSVKDKSLVAKLFYHLKSKVEENLKVNATVLDFINSELREIAQQYEEKVGDVACDIVETSHGSHSNPIALLDNDTNYGDDQPTAKTKPKKETPKDKAQYAEFVTLKEKEYQTLVSKHGEEATKGMIEILNNYKGQSRKNQKKYDSDYYAINSWVVKEWMERQAKKVAQQGKYYNSRRSFDEECKEMEERLAEKGFVINND